MTRYSRAGNSDMLLPKSRIEFSSHRVKVGGQSFQSASDALSAYLQQFEATEKRGSSRPHVHLTNNHGSSKSSVHLTNQRKNKDYTRSRGLSGHKEDVEKLFTSKVSQLRGARNDDLREMKLTKLLQQIDPEQERKTELQEEVEAALLRSAQLLEKVTKDNNPVHKAGASDISSIPTDVLLLESRLSINSSKFIEKPPGHIYSYRTPRNRRPLQNHNFSPPHSPISYSRERKRHSSLDLLCPRYSNGSSPSLSQASDSVISRCRSVSPAMRNPSLPLSGGLKYSDPKSAVPSWVKDEHSSDISDSVWTSKTLQPTENNDQSKLVPNWVKQMSNGTSVEPTEYFHADTSNTSKNHLHPLNLTQSVLRTPHKQFTLSDDYYSVKQPKHSTPVHHSLRTLDKFYQHPQVSLVARSEPSASVGVSVVGAGEAKPPASSPSSVDTLALLTGNFGANSSHRNKDIKTDSQRVTSPCVSVIGQCPSSINNGLDLYSLDGLDGDRPWEQITNAFKPPVHVDDTQCRTFSKYENIEGTLTGGKQPGSIEALKNMLFKLQAEESSVMEEQFMASDQEDYKKFNSDEDIDLLPALKDYDFKQEPGGQSLKKALVHLNKLKELVKSNQYDTTV